MIQEQTTCKARQVEEGCPNNQKTQNLDRLRVAQPFVSMTFSHGDITTSSVRIGGSGVDGGGGWGRVRIWFVFSRRLPP